MAECGLEHNLSRILSITHAGLEIDARHDARSQELADEKKFDIVIRSV